MRKVSSCRVAVGKIWLHDAVYFKKNCLEMFHKQRRQHIHVCDLSVFTVGAVHCSVSNFSLEV